MIHRTIQGFLKTSGKNLSYYFLIKIIQIELERNNLEINLILFLKQSRNRFTGVLSSTYESNSHENEDSKISI